MIRRIRKQTHFVHQCLYSLAVTVSVSVCVNWPTQEIHGGSTNCAFIDRFVVCIFQPLSLWTPRSIVCCVALERIYTLITKIVLVGPGLFH